jgi:hypothetical protein
MHFVPISPPAQVQVFGGFDYVATDADRRRVFAAHTGSQALMIVNGDTGALIGQVRVGPMHGVAVDPATGDVFTGDGEARTVSEVDPVALKVVASADVDGKVDAIAYDPSLHRVYADEDDGTRMFVVDTQSMKQIATIQLPGHKPEYPAIDPSTHLVYQNIDDLAEIAVIDPQQLKVVRTIPTPDIKHDHPLLFDSAYGILITGGKNSLAASYDRDGKLLAITPVPAGIDQCALDSSTHRFACAGSGTLSVMQLSANGQFTPLAILDVPTGVHTLAFDAKTGHLWIVWSETKGDFYQELALAP